MRASIQVLGDRGYVWDADVAHWLRLECGIVGAMVGGVAAFKQQNAVHGLPLELSPDEVTLALEKGWGELQAALCTAEQAAAAARAGSGGAAGHKRQRPGYHDYQYEYDEDEEMEDGSQQQQQEQQQRAEPTWRAALAAGSHFVIPTLPAAAAAANAGRDVAAAAEAAAEGAAEGAAAGAAEGAAGAGGGRVEWTFPATEEERHRYLVFRDLHSKGFRLTGGSKFGADFLLYPGDPTLYHAQFCVRLLPFRQPILPAMLASATRGSHQARKHLLVASVVMGEAEVAAEEAAEAAAAKETAAAGGGQAAAPAGERQQQKQQGEQGEQPPGDGPEPQEAAGPPALAERLGACVTGVGAGGERYRIHYMTIGPVEGFGG